MDKHMTNITFISDDEFAKKIADGKLFFKNLINDNNEMIDLIKLDLMIKNNLKDISDFEIEKLEIDSNNLYLVFKADNNSLETIKNNFANTEAVCEEDTEKNFNKYKLNRHFLLPIDFEVKLRNPSTHMDYLKNEFIRILKEQIVFNSISHEYDYDGTLFNYFEIYKKHIKTMDKQEIDNHIVRLANRLL